MSAEREVDRMDHVRRSVGSRRGLLVTVSPEQVVKGKAAATWVHAQVPEPVNTATAGGQLQRSQHGPLVAPN